MDILQYRQFIELVQTYKIFPFASFVPDYPSLTALTVHNDWHKETDTDPWGWRIRIAQDGEAAYGKFFGDKACFIDKALFPAIQTALTNNKTVEERYYDGLISHTAWRMYNIIIENEHIDSRELRKLSGLHEKDSKREYDKALVELQNNADVVITGSAKSSENDAGWNSMCFMSANAWLTSIHSNHETLTVAEAQTEIIEALKVHSSEKAMQYFVKKLKLDRS